jgi:hypothetical protein
MKHLTVDLIIFANSIKRNQHCVAWKEISSKKRIRPISGEWIEHELNRNQCTCEMELLPVQLLEKIRIPLLLEQPSVFQPENYLISDHKRKYLWKVDRREISNYLDHPESLRISNWHPNDRIPENNIITNEITVEQSLYLLFVENIKIYRKDRSQRGKSPQRRGSFNYKNVFYDFALTDPQFGHFNETILADKYICISLSAPFQWYCYKIIAAIL